MMTKLNFLEKALLELDFMLGNLFATYEFGGNYRKYKGLYVMTPFERKRIAIISLRAANLG